MKVKGQFAVVRSYDRNRIQVEVVLLCPSSVEVHHGPSCQVAVLLARGKSLEVVVRILRAHLLVVHMHLLRLLRLLENHILAEVGRIRLCLWHIHSIVEMGSSRESLVILDVSILQMPLLPSQHLAGSDCRTGLCSAVSACRSDSHILVCRPLAWVVPWDLVHMVACRHWYQRT